MSGTTAIYGVDFGCHAIKICKMTICDDKMKLDMLMDQMGSRLIPNGVQIIDPPADADAITSYKLRRMGNECIRSKPMSNYNEFVITMRDVSIVTHIREIIDNDVKESQYESPNVHVVFALSMERELIRRYKHTIQVLFNLDNPYKLEFVKDAYAQMISKFATIHPEFYARHLGKETDDKRSSTVGAILDAGEDSIHFHVVRFERHVNKYTVHSLKKFQTSAPGARFFKDKIAMMINDEYYRCTGEISKIVPTDRTVERILHDLSMYESVSRTIDVKDAEVKITFKRSDFDDVEGRRAPVIRKINEMIRDFLPKIEWFEVVGGFSRSFVVSEMLRQIDMPFRQTMNADEVTARGAAYWGVKEYLESRVSNRSCLLPSAPSFTLVRHLKDPICAGSVREPGGPATSLKSSAVWAPVYTSEYSESLANRIMIARRNSTNVGHGETRDPTDLAHFSFVISECMAYVSDYSDGIIFEVGANTGASDDVIKVPNESMDGIIDLYATVDMLDGPYFVAVRENGFSYVEKKFNRVEKVYEQADIIESRERVYRDAYDKCKRIGDIYNHMEAFYFDRDAYAAKKAQIMEHKRAIKTKYSYTESDSASLETELKTLVDKYEFCRVVTIDPDLLNEAEYAPDPLATPDPRLNRITIDTLIRDDKVLVMMENMMK